MKRACGDTRTMQGVKRECGGCTTCCKLVPVREGVTGPNGEFLFELFNKPAGQRCPHQRSRCGCAIYETRPRACRHWNCHWLVGKDTEGLSRPDRVHYVIDTVLDFIRVTDTRTGQEQKVVCIQVWVDPAFPSAHRDPGLRELLNRRKMPGLIRHSDKEAFVLFPPSRTPDGQWHELRSNVTREMEHSPTQIMEAVAAANRAETDFTETYEGSK